MKQQSETMVENAVKVLLKTLQRNFEDAGNVLDRFEETHDDKECHFNRNYQALVTGHFHLGKDIEKINRQLNKKL